MTRHRVPCSRGFLVGSHTTGRLPKREAVERSEGWSTPRQPHYKIGRSGSSSESAASSEEWHGSIATLSSQHGHGGGGMRTDSKQGIPLPHTCNPRTPGERTKALRPPCGENEGTETRYPPENEGAASTGGQARVLRRPCGMSGPWRALRPLGERRHWDTLESE